MGRVRGIFLGGMASLLLLAFAASANAAVTADPAVTILYVKGDAEANQIQVDCGTGIVLVNGAPAADGHANCADLEKLEVFGFGGDDTISLTGFSKLPADEDAFFGSDYGEGDSVEFAAYGGDGNDDVAGDAGLMALSGGAGNDRVRSLGILSIMLGGPGDDALTGGRLLNFMFGGGGSDRLDGRGGFNLAFGGAGPDVFAGGPGEDLAGGGKGHDQLVGNGGRDALLGGAGGDSLFGGAAADVLAGNRGRDALHGGPGDDHVFQASTRHGRLERIFHIFGSQDSDSETVAFSKRLAPRLFQRLVP